MVEARAHAHPIVMSGPGDFANRLSGCPLRFVLADSLTRASAELAFSGGDRLAGCLDLLRFPVSLMWIEWSDEIHQDVTSQRGIIAQRDSNSVGRQVGLLLQATAGGRAAVARTFWSAANPDGECEAVMSPLETHIDLDARFAPRVSTDAMLGGEFACVSCDEPGVHELLERVRFKFDDRWSKYYSEGALGAGAREKVVLRSLAGVAHDIPLILAFFLLLNAKGATRPIPIQRQRLNRRRQGKDRPALLDHIEVHASLPGHSPEERDDDAPPGRRRPPRLHGVRGHLVRREDRVFWRTPHLRGSARHGIVRSRTVCLSFSRAS
jgi:hypothetical protein